MRTSVSLWILAFVLLLARLADGQEPKASVGWNNRTGTGSTRSKFDAPPKAELTSFKLDQNRNMKREGMFCARVETENFIVWCEYTDAAKMVGRHAEYWRKRADATLVNGKGTPWSQKCNLYFYCDAIAFENDTKASRNQRGYTTKSLSVREVYGRELKMHADVVRRQSSGEPLSAGEDKRLRDEAIREAIFDVLPHEVCHLVTADYVFSYRDDPQTGKQVAYPRHPSRWFDEGIAQCFETDDSKRRRIRLAAETPWKVKDLLTQREYPKRLDDVRSFYVNSYAFCRFIDEYYQEVPPGSICRPGWAMMFRLESWVSFYGDPEVGVRKNFGKTLQELEADYRAWLKVKLDKR